MKITDTHVYFYSEKDWLSNFYPSYFTVRGKSFFCVEQAFMYAKAMFFKDYATAGRILAVSQYQKNPQMACKFLGRKVEPYDEEMWDEVCDKIMASLVYQKFKQSPELLELFLSTKNRILVEASKKDRKWGVGLSEGDYRILDKRNWKGSNRLGKSLMTARRRLENESVG